jgi:N-acetylmuramoyl-L-alanine amidase CwlA
MFDKNLYTIVADYLPKNSKRRSGSQLPASVRFIVAHDTGNPGSTAAQNVRYYRNTCNDQSASAHLFVDDITIIECIPAVTGVPEKAWHVLYKVTGDNQLFGCDANDAAIGVEYCYGGGINADKAYQKYVWMLAYLCVKFNLNPKADIVGHFFLDPTRKTDPVTGLAYSRRTYDQLLRDVANEVSGAGAVAEAPAAKLINQAGSVRATTTLNIRQGMPSRLASVAQTVPAQTKLDYTGWVDDGEPVNGNSKWFVDAAGRYFWSGATQPA